VNEPVLEAVRPADETELDQLARVWFQSWQDAHAAIVPAELTRARTLESFAQRLGGLLFDTRVVGPVGSPVGFCIVKDDELYQLFVAAEARGSGVAAALIADAERVLADRGVRTAWLACAIGNERAARFYEKFGWRRSGTIVSQLETTAGVIPLEVWRYEKDLRV
jgi:ribosomal protein S18 acetylase RimI-like enzyme